MHERRRGKIVVPLREEAAKYCPNLQPFDILPRHARIGTTVLMATFTLAVMM